MIDIKSLSLTALLIAAASCMENKGAFDASGVFEATEITVSSEGNGKIISFTAEEGDKVNAGDTLGCIDTVQLHFTKLQLEAERQAIGSSRHNIANQIASLERQIDKQKTELARFSRLAEAGAAGEKQVEDITSQIDVLEKQLTAQRETLSNANSGVSGKIASLDAQIAQIDDRIRKCIITSPADGIILAKYAEEGELAGQGRPLFKVADLDNVRLRAYITADQLTELKLGQEMKVFADLGECGRKEYAGTLTWISGQAEFTPKTIQTRDERANLVYPVKVSVKNDGIIKLGMYGEIKF